MGFLSDLGASEEAVDVVLKHLIENDYVCYTLDSKEEQKFGDIRIIEDENELNIEIKFDKKAEKTGNLCFEMSNGKRLTGILETKADLVFYVTKINNKYTIYKFIIDDLRKYILKPENVTIKNGGDNKKFTLALVSINKVIEDALPYEVSDA